MMANKDLRGKIGLVTGSTRGIGRTIAEEMAKAGATVVISGTRASDVARVVEEMAASGHRALGRPATCAATTSGSADGLRRRRGRGLTSSSTTRDRLFSPVSEMSPGGLTVIDTNSPASSIARAPRFAL
jgi:hypothetical protein